jgi:hypothetical protein
MRIPLTAVGQVARTRHRHAYEAPYRAFIAASLTLGIGGGLMLAVLLPLARAFGWGWVDGLRWQALVQAHGQLQLLGFGGLFVMGMAFRLMPRFSGRQLALRRLVPFLIPIVASSLILRSIAEPAPLGTARDAALIVSAALLLVAAATFAAVVIGTLAHPASKAEDTAYYLILGAVGYCVGAALNFMQVLDTVREGAQIAPLAKQTPLVFIQQYGFLIMFVSGIGSRAVPTLTGAGRRPAVSRVTAIVFATGVALFEAAALWSAYRTPSTLTARVGDTGLLCTAAAFVALAWTSGALTPGKSRVAAASRTQFWFVRSAYAWLVAAAVLTAWYATRGIIDAHGVGAFELDAIRHTLTIGLVTMMIVGMAMLIVPEFAARRMHHPNERFAILSMVVMLNAAAALRIWPAIEGVNWLASTRYWPMAASGALASTAVIAFGAMFAQSWWEGRQESR